MHGRHAPESDTRRERVRLTSERSPYILGSLRNADIVLFHNSSPYKSPVVHCQKAFGFRGDAAHISHVALYVGQGLICHSNPRLLHGYGGVTMEELSRAADGQDVTVVRFEELNGEEGLQKLDGICALAKFAQGCPYNYKGVFDLAVGAAQMLINKGRGAAYLSEISRKYDIENVKHVLGVSAASNEFLCSDFVFNCYDEVLREENPLSDPNVMRSPNRLPAEFYENSRLSTVQLLAG